MTQVGALPLQAGKGVFHGVTRVFGRGGGGGNHSSEDGSIIDVAEIGPDHAPGPIGAGESGPDHGISDTGGRENEHLAEPGVVKVTVLEAKDYNPSGEALKPYVVLKSGDKEHKTSHRAKSTGSECSW